MVSGGDLAKTCLNQRGEIEQLRRQNQRLQDELTGLKEGIKKAIQNSDKNQSNHFTSLLESQSQELTKLKRLIDEYNRREKQCQRKWNTLLRENMEMQQKMALEGQQLVRQRDQFQAIIVNTENKVIEANKRLAQSMQNPEKRASAEYLVEQIRGVQADNTTLLEDNQKLAYQVESLRFENERLWRDLQQHQMAQDNVQRIEELEDLVHELRSQASAQQIIELEQIIQEQSLQVGRLERLVQDLQKRRENSSDLFDKNEMYETYKKLIGERDEVIKTLVQRMQELKQDKVISQGVVAQGKADEAKPLFTFKEEALGL